VLSEEKTGICQLSVGLRSAVNCQLSPQCPHRLRQDNSSITLDAKIGKLIVCSRTLIDNDVHCSMFLGRSRHGSGGFHFEGGSNSDHQVGARSSKKSLPQFILRHRLPERDSGWLEESLTGTQGGLTGAFEVLKDGVWFAKLATGLAFDLPIGPVQLDHSVLRVSGELVQSVNILGHQRIQAPDLFQLMQCPVGWIGLSVTNLIPTLKFELPVADTSLVRVHEVIVVDGLPFFPQALRTPKVGDTRSGRDACTGEGEDSMGLGQEGSQLQGWGSVFYFPSSGWALRSTITGLT